MRFLRRRMTGDRPLSCEDVGRLLQRYLDGEIDNAQVTARVSEHLEDCRRCGLELDVYREIKAALAQQAPALPETALDRLRGFGDELAQHEHDHRDGEHR